ncbi:MAG TPA: phage holin family protein [Acetivibrio sp.]|nr:phage holin family protein [Clostridium sp.]HOQ36472.1 phage holin family protein [Acetivibrio sp.]HPT90778.1 phage holin family protein [Acetivibrio sp.]HQA56692.1 phage holin family protein [Acetivibrio sp.]
MANFNNARVENFNITHFIIRLVVGAIVLAITAFLTPGFSITGFWPLIISAVILAALDYLVLRFLGVNATPFGRGISGFILSAAIIYITQYFVAGYSVTLLGAILGAVIYGIVDAFIPGRAM